MSHSRRSELVSVVIDNLHLVGPEAGLKEGISKLMRSSKSSRSHASMMESGASGNTKEYSVVFTETESFITNDDSRPGSLDSAAPDNKSELLQFIDRLLEGCISVTSRKHNT